MNGATAARRWVTTGVIGAIIVVRLDLNLIMRGIGRMEVALMTRG